MLLDDETADLIAQAITYDLDVPGDWVEASNDQRAETYNGIGPDWLPELLREWATSLWHYFAAAALIHDWEYATTKDRSKKSFWLINNRFRKNCKRLLKMKGCPWYKRWLYERRIDALADACDTFGFPGFLAAGKVDLKK